MLLRTPDEQRTDEPSPVMPQPGAWPHTGETWRLIIVSPLHTPLQKIDLSVIINGPNKIRSEDVRLKGTSSL